MCQSQRYVIVPKEAIRFGAFFVPCKIIDTTELDARYAVKQAVEWLCHNSHIERLRVIFFFPSTTSTKAVARLFLTLCSPVLISTCTSKR